MLEADELTARAEERPKAQLKSRGSSDRQGAGRHRGRGRRTGSSALAASDVGPAAICAAHSSRAHLDLFERVVKARQGIAVADGGRRPLHDLPRPPAPAGLQHDPHATKRSCSATAASACSTSTACAQRIGEPVRPRSTPRHARQIDHERPTSCDHGERRRWRPRQPGPGGLRGRHHG